MSSAMTDLRRWFHASPEPTTAVDWAPVESELGTALPADYKEFVDRFGGLRIQFLYVHAPGGWRTISDGQKLLKMLFDLDLSGPAAEPGWPAPENLLLWGEIDSDPLLCWDRSTSVDPDEWRTGVFDTVGTLVWLDGNMTTCIRDMITGRQRPRVLGGDFAKPELWVTAGRKRYPVQLDA